MSSSPIHVLALGARTPVGLRAESAAAAVRAGISRLGEFPFLVGTPGEPLIAARDPRLAASTRLPERLVAMALSALEEVVRKLLAGYAWLPKLHIVLALPERRAGFTDVHAAEVCRELAERTSTWGLNAEWHQVGRGHAGVCLGLELARQQLSQLASEVWIVGGADSYMDPATLNALYDDRRLQTADTRSGFQPGEGAGFLALAKEQVRHSLHLRSIGVLRGVKTSQETKLARAGDVSRAEGLVQAVLGACASLQTSERWPSMVLCDINGERHRAEEWALLQLRIGERMSTSAYDTAVSYWGDQGAATVPLLIALACRSWARGYASDERALVWAASESGLRGAVVIEQPTQDP